MIDFQESPELRKESMTKDKEKLIEKKSRANRKHSIYAFRDRGEVALDDPQRSVYIELRDQFKSEPGRLEYREHLAAHLAMMLELGFSHVGQLAEKGYPVWQSPPVARMGVYINALQRLIDHWPKDKQKAGNVLDLIMNNQKDNDNEQTKDKRDQPGDQDPGR